MKEKEHYNIFDNGHTPMLIIDSDSGEIKDANRAACSYYGYGLDKLLELKITDINTLSQHEVFDEMLRARKEDRKFFRFKHRLANGEVKEVEVYSGPLADEGGRLLFSIIHDIEDKRAMEHKIKQQQSYFESLYEHCPEAIVMLDNDFRIMNINRSFERIFQYGIDEIRYKDITEVLCEKRFYDESTYFKDCIERGEFIRKEIQRKRKDGSLVEVSFLGYPIFNNGKQMGVYGFYYDMTKIKEEKKEQEKRIQMYINILRSTINTNTDTIAVFRPDFSVALVNEAGCRYFGLPNDSLEGMNWNEIIRSRFADDDHYAVKAIETKQSYSIETWFSDTDQYFYWRCDPIFNEEGELLLIVERIRDITEKKKYEEQLKAAKLRAEETSRFKSRFIASMTHEIRTPMNGIVGIIDLLQDTRLCDEQKEYLQMLKYSAGRLSSIINDVLDISKIEAGKLELRNIKFNIKKLVNDAARYFKVQAGRKGLDLNCHLAPGIPDFLMGDPDKLNQILFNLLSNAVKFTDTGRINIDIRLVASDESKVSLYFAISDTGIGIPKEKLGSVFEDFYQLENIKNRKHSGTGLGLPIARKLAQLMGSDIILESEHKKGCTFSFTVAFPVPLLQDLPVISEPDGKGHVAEVLSAFNILIVEDDSINQKILKKLLERSGINVTLAANGKEALRILEKRVFDVILMDIYMPEMNGCDTTKKIREKEAGTGRYTPIIALTAAVQYEEREKYYEAGIDDCIAKPCGRNQIYSVIARVLKSKYQTEVFSLESLVDRLEGDYELARDIIEEVVSGSYEKELFDGIEKYLKEKDLEKLSSHIHKFKGSLSHFQVGSIDEVLGEIKEKCKTSSFSDIEKLCGSLKQEYKRLKECLESCGICAK